MKPIVLLLPVLLPFSSAAQAPGSEISQLLVALEESNCQFNRNGKWYEGKRARDHLQRKYDYIAKRKAKVTTEEFIDLAASGSSLSGRPYLVRCGDSDPIESERWFLEKLAGLRRNSGRP